MKTKFLTFTLSFLSLGTLFNKPSLQASETQQASTESIFDKIPTVGQVTKYGYHAANLAAWGLVAYVGWKAYNNDSVRSSVKTLYNLATCGDTITTQERQAIREKKAKKHKDIQETAATVQQHTAQLTQLLSGIQVLQLASENFATKQDLENLVTKSDFAAFEERMTKKLDTIIEQTRNKALIDAALMGSRKNK